MFSLTTYSIFLASNNELIGIVASKKQAREFILMYLIYDNYSHYTEWCKLRNYDENSKDVMEEYVETRFGYMVYDEEFLTIRYKFKKKELFGYLRVINRCALLPTSFVSNTEALEIERIINNKELKEEENNTAITS